MRRAGIGPNDRAASVAVSAQSGAEARRARVRKPAVQQPLADGAVLSRPRRQPRGAAVQIRDDAVGVHPACARRQGIRHHPRRALPDRRLADRQSDPDRGVFRLRELRLEDRSRRPSGLAGLDDQGPFRRAEAEAARLDRRDLGDPGAEGVHEHRCRVRPPEDGLAGRRACWCSSSRPCMLALSDRWGAAITVASSEWRMASGICAIRYSPLAIRMLSRTLRNSLAAGSSTNSEPSATPK